MIKIWSELPVARLKEQVADLATFLWIVFWGNIVWQLYQFLAGPFDVPWHRDVDEEERSSPTGAGDLDVLPANDDPWGARAADWWGRPIAPLKLGQTNGLVVT